MLFIPYNVALHLVKKPLVTYAVILLCLVVHQLQWNNRHVIEEEVKAYCHTIKHSVSPDGTFDVFRQKFAYCTEFLIWMHTSPDRDVVTEGLRPVIQSSGDFTDEKLTQGVKNANKHYQVLQSQLPESLDGKLMYYPDEYDLVRMVTAVFAHADWLHIISNLIFFFAFAQGVEGIINNKLKYSGIFLGILFISQVAYSIYSSGMALVVPTLGLSGVVMGMMGVSLYLLPHARIKVFIWGFRFVNIYYIPTWILAVVYIGWDTVALYLNGQQGGVNLVAHVSGGFAGIILAFVFLGKCRQDARDQLAEETDFQVSRKKDFNSYDVSSKYGRTDLANRYALKQNKKEFETYMQEVFTLVSVRRDAEAMMLLINDYSRYQQDTGLLEQVFYRISDWGKSRTLLCTGRMLIDLLLDVKQYAHAIRILKQCQDISPEFVLADPDVASLLVRYAIEMHEYEVAFYLVHNAGERYSAVVNIIPMLIREAELCLLYLDKTAEGKAIIKQLLSGAGDAYKDEIMALGKLAQKI